MNEEITMKTDKIKVGAEPKNVLELNYSTLNKKIGKKIKSRRIEMKLSQEELANKLHYRHKSSITKIEKGKTDIPLSKLVMIGKLLKINFCKEISEA